jgi:hypothetical protein
LPELLLVFQGIHQTLGAEEVLKARGMKTSLVPTPLAISLGCGFSILVSAEGDEAAPPWWEELKKTRALYRIIAKEGRKIYEEIDRREGAGLPAAAYLEPQDAGRGGARRDRGEGR